MITLFLTSTKQYLEIETAEEAIEIQKDIYKQSEAIAWIIYSKETI